MVTHTVQQVLDMYIERPNFIEYYQGTKTMNTYGHHLRDTVLKCIPLLGLCSVVVMGEANAQETVPPSGFKVHEFRVGVGISAERWSEEAIASVYDKNGKMFPTLSLSYRFHKRLSLDASAGTGRLETDSGRNELQLLPITVGGSLLFGNENREPFVSVAAGFVQFSESNLPFYDSARTVNVYGTKLGVDTKAGVRIGTNLISGPSHHPRAASGASQMDIELAMGYRVHQAFGVGTGLNMNAFHTSIGVNIRY